MKTDMNREFNCSGVHFPFMCVSITFCFVETLRGHKKEEGNTNTGGSFTPSLPHPR